MMVTSEEIRAKTRPELLTSDGQTWLVGETVYVRPLTLADAEYASAWRGTGYPEAPERTRGWIADTLIGGHGKAFLLIVRRVDDRPLGSVTVDYRTFPHHEVTVHIDPLYGERAEAWRAEALAMILPWIVDEQERPKAGTRVAARETAVISAIEAIGARATARFREKLATPGGRDDELIYEYLSRSWVERLGDPAGVEAPRTGTGVARPVSLPIVPAGDPPANAMRVGSRVYLRPPQDADAAAFAHWSTREIDASWENGRHPFSTGAARRWFEGFQKETPPETIDFAVCLRETDEFIGLVGILDVDYRHGVGESASMIVNPAYREAGYGSEAKHLMFDHVFNEVGLHALQSFVMFDNPRSAAALRKQGYREAGREHWIEPRDGTFVNYLCFDLLADEWRALPRQDVDARGRA
jgi:RimJ/RimL family protein N-acetyltransferase